jgi:transposase
LRFGVAIALERFSSTWRAGEEWTCSPLREAETAAAWMRKPPELCVVSRDRGGEYAKAATLGAPQATQCADRFHVVKHLTEATQVLLARCQAEILEASDQGESSRQEPNKALISIEHWRPPEPPYVEKARLARRASRYARYQQVVELGQRGMTPKEIAGRLGLSDRTVQKWLAAGTFASSQETTKKTEFL